MKRGVTLIEVLVVVAIIAIVIALLWGFLGSNFWAKKFGRTISVDAPAKVVNVTWKDNNLWVLTRPVGPGDKPEVLTFQEYSNFGVLQGRVVVTERFPEQK